MAISAQRYFHDFGMTREDLAQIPLNSRRNAMKNPKAVMRSTLTLEDYLGARSISSPLCLFDCDVPIDCSTAFIVSSIDAARDCRRKPIHFEAMSGAIYGRDSWDQFDDLTTMAARDAAKRLWERTDLRPKDIDVAEIYDGFSILTVFWLEALGFCKKRRVQGFHRERHAYCARWRTAPQYERGTTFRGAARTAWDSCTKPARNSAETVANAR